MFCESFVSQFHGIYKEKYRRLYKKYVKKKILFYTLFEILFYWCFKYIICSEECKFEFMCMEPLSHESKLFECFFVHLFISVDFIANNGVPYRCKMYSDLVSSPCEEVYL